MDRPEKVAMPVATVTAEPPLRVPPAGVGPDGQAHRGGVVRGLDVAAGVFDRHRHGRGDGGPGGGVGGTLDEGQLGGWADEPAVMLKAAEVAAVYEGVLEAVSV